MVYSFGMMTGILPPITSQRIFHNQVMAESVTMIATVDFLEREVEKKLLEIDEAEANYNYEKLDRLKAQVMSLLSKLDKEVENMDSLRKKFRSMANHEKQKMLFSLSQKKQVFIRGVPPQSRGSQKG